MATALAVQDPQPGTAVATTQETASTAVAAQARAAVEARYLMAIRQPRDWMQVRVKLLDACRRPGFAAMAKYAKPVGGGNKVVGPSIRFAEEALRCMGNSLIESMVVFDDREKRIVRVTVTDLEANLSYPTDIILEKTVERRQPKTGQTVLRARMNSTGQTVYIVEATEDDLLNKQNALASKAIRGGGLRVLPGDLLEEAMALVDTTLANQDAADPKGAQKKIVDAFHAMGVSPTDIAAYLGHPIEQSTPAEVASLRHIFSALKEGESTWAQIMETKDGESVPAGNGAAPKETKGTAALKEHLAKGKKEKAPETDPDMLAELARQDAADKAAP